MLVAGVDGCRDGWIVATVCDDPAGSSELTFAPHISAIIDDVRSGRLAAVAIDMPIGLPDDAPRASDAIARAELGVRRSTLFPTPARATLHCETFPEALSASREAIGVGLSKQAFYLLPKIREIDAYLGRGDQPSVFEAHPELSFQEMTGQALDKKTSAAGSGQRLQALLLHFDDLVEQLARTPVEARLDDALDAYAMAWTALRVAMGTARTVVGDVLRDSAGRDLSLRV